MISTQKELSLWQWDYRPDKALQVLKKKKNTHSEKKNQKESEQKGLHVHLKTDMSRHVFSPLSGPNVCNDRNTTELQNEGFI